MLIILWKISVRAMGESEIKKDASHLPVKFGMKMYVQVITFGVAYSRLKGCQMFSQHHM